MAEAAISCSSGCAVQIRSIRDRWLPVKRRTERYLRPEQGTPLQAFAARLNIFTYGLLPTRGHVPAALRQLLLQRLAQQLELLLQRIGV